MQFVEHWLDGGLVGAEKLDDVAGGFRGEAFFEVVDAVFSILGWEGMDAVEIVNVIVMGGGVFDNLPLDKILGVVIFHIALITAAKEIDDCVAG